MQFNSHSFDSISYQVIIPPQITMKVEHSRIIPILIFQFQCPGVEHSNFEQTLTFNHTLFKEELCIREDHLQDT